MENKPLEGTKLYLDGKWIRRFQYVVTICTRTTSKEA